MNSFDTQYKKIIEQCLSEGFLRPTRSGIPAYSIIGATITHDMAEGFPISTLRKMPQKGLRVELEFYLKGRTDKSWLNERGCHFWDYWQSKEFDNPNDLGPTYGFEWRHFGAEYKGIGDYTGQGVDQIQWVIEKLKKYPENKRLVVSQWNPKDIGKQAIPPCPFAFQLLKHGDKLNLIFFQRSGDVCLGMPTDFSEHALLLHLFCKETGYKEGKVIAMLGQVELYKNHVEGAKELLKRESFILPKVQTENFTSILNWSYEDTEFINYQHGEKLDFPIAI